MARIALCDASGPLTDLLQKLSGESGDLHLSILNKMLRGELTSAVKRTYSIWKKIKLGTHQDAKSLKEDIEKNGFTVNEYAAVIMTKPMFTLATEETMVNLVNVSASDLGFTKKAPLRDIYLRAIELGLKLCPAEVGPQLRLQYPDQPNDQWVYVAMEAIADLRLHPLIFRIGSDREDRWLGTYCDDPSDMWALYHRFIFCD